MATCTICTHPLRAEIEFRSVKGDTWESIGEYANTSHMAPQRHYKNCNWANADRLTEVRNKLAREESALDRRVTTVQKKASAELAAVKTASMFDADNRVEAMAFILSELTFLREWALDMTEEMRQTQDMDYNTQMKMLESFRKIVVSISETYTAFARLKLTEDEIVSAADDTKLLRAELLAAIRQKEMAVNGA